MQKKVAVQTLMALIAVAALTVMKVMDIFVKISTSASQMTVI